jgi:uncharacterized protein YegP (UPF0339 family)
MRKLILLLITISLFNCQSDKVLFTVAVRNQLIAKGIPLDTLQYYTEKQFQLQRELSNSEFKAVSGKIKQVSGKRINILNFYSLTPCILKADSTEKMYFGFEEESNRTLKFYLFRKTGEYRLSYLPNNQEIIYGDEKYTLKSTHEIRIMIKKNTLNSTKITKSTVKGLKIK